VEYQEQLKAEAEAREAAHTSGEISQKSAVQSFDQVKGAAS